MKRVIAALVLAVAVAAAPPNVPAQPQGRASFNFKDARAQDALRLIASQFGMNLVVGKDVSGTLTANLSNVTFPEAVAFVAEATGCDYRLNENVLVVNAAGLESRVFPLRYIDPMAASGAVLKVLSARGSAEPFSGRGGGSTAPGALISSENGARSNALIVTDTPARVAQVAAVLAEIDKRPRLVAIEAKLVETVLGDDEKLGVDWQLRASAKGAVLPTTFPFPKSAGSG
ncbi:MAG TPA: secretin N-terminal domain-containing protein, partial [Candidatus Eisenbacteria bacterium]|nr:secretin N-terminal domain-containing protein [Candidatus Eisenbacteria bacterium]